MQLVSLLCLSLRIIPVRSIPNGTHLGRYLWYSRFYADAICPNSNIPPIFFSALLYPECTAFLPNLHTRQKHGTRADAPRKS